MAEDALDVEAMLAGRPELLHDALDRSLAYLGGVADRAVAPEPAAVDRLSELDFPLPGPGLAAMDVLRLVDDFGSPGDCREQRAAVLRVRDRRRAAGRAGRDLAQHRLGSERGAVGDVAGRRAAELRGAALDHGADPAAGGRRGRVRDRRDDGERDLPRRSARRCPDPARLERGRPGSGRCAAGDRRRRSRSPYDGAQGAWHRRSRPGSCRGPAGGRPGADRPKRPARARRAIDRLPAGGEREHGGERPVPAADRRGLGAARRGFTSMARSGCGRLQSPSVAGQVAGIEAADSWAADCHKWLNTTYDCGVALVRDPDALRAAMGASASYLPGSGDEAMNLLPQSSQRARGVEVWAALASLGRDGLAELVARSCRLARRFAAGMTAGGFDVLNDVVLNQVLVSFGDGRADRCGDRRGAGRGHVLVRAHDVAGRPRDAGQRQRLEHDGRRHRPEHRCRAVLRWRVIRRWVARGRAVSRGW